MKILKVIISNIHSLKGEHEIDFAHGILADVGLYAITGQTGAGKSTILDAITLALYGQTNRHGNAKADEEIITRNEKDAFAETTFEVNNQSYLARWEVAYSRNKTLKDSERKLYRIVDNQLVIISDKKTNTQAEILKIIGLTFEQFTKSVLLAQNNFSAFLKAKPAERAEMLSKITGTEVYELVSKSVFEKTKILESELNLSKALLNTNLLSEDEIAGLQKELSAKTEKTKEITAELKQTALQIKWLDDINKTSFELENYQLQFGEVEKIIAGNELVYKQLEKHSKALLIEKQLLAYENAERQLQKNTSDLLVIREKLVEARGNFENVKKDIDLKSISSGLIKKELDEKLPLIQEANVLIQSKLGSEKFLREISIEIGLKNEDLEKNHTLKSFAEKERNEINTQITKCEHQANEYKIFARWNEEKGAVQEKYRLIDQLSKEIIAIKTIEIEKEIEVIQQKLASQNAELASGKEKLEAGQSDLTSFANKKNDLKSTAALIQEKELAQSQLNQWNELKLHVSQKFEIDNKLNPGKQRLQFLLQEESLKNEAFAKQDEQVKLLTDNLQLHIKIASLDEHRDALIDGEDCPLCGSKTHPYSTDTIHYTPDKTKQLLELAQVSLEKIRKEAEAISKEKTTVETAIKLNTEQVEAVQSQIEKLKIALHLSHIPAELTIIENCEKLQKAIELSSEAMEVNTKLDKEIEAKNSTIQIIKDAIQVIEISKTELGGQISNLKNELVRNKAAITKNKEDISNYYATVQTALKPFGMALSKYEIGEISEIGQKLNQNYGLWKVASEQLPDLREKIGKCNTANAEIEVKISSVSEELTALNRKKSENETALEKIKTSIEAITQNFTLKIPSQEEERLRQSEKTLEAELSQLMNKQSGLASTISENEKSLNQLINEKETLEIDFKNSSLALENQLAANQFESKEALKTALQMPDAKEIAEQKQKHETEIVKLKGLIAASHEELKTFREQTLTNKTLEELGLEKAALEASNQQIHQEIGGIKEKLISNESDIKANNDRIAEIQNKEVVYIKWEQLNMLIGSKTGDSFKKFAQDFTLSLLVQFANRHLEVMYNRYELHKDDNSSEMELQIKDKQFFEQIRTVNSLSGGETFLVSLALALGLSDLASKNTKIRSLFIDEGFGTLDPESLNNALDALELLRQTDDRQIGIISHVEELKKRINTQIKVTKISPEFSSISISD